MAAAQVSAYVEHARGLSCRPHRPLQPHEPAPVPSPDRPCRCSPLSARDQVPDDQPSAGEQCTEPAANVDAPGGCLPHRSPRHLSLSRHTDTCTTPSVPQSRSRQVTGREGAYPPGLPLPAEHARGLLPSRPHSAPAAAVRTCCLPLLTPHMIALADLQVHSLVSTTATA